MTGPRPSVYIVDDDEAVRDSIRLLLESSGFVAREFASADLFLRTDTGDMGCLLLDLHMPGIGPGTSAPAEVARAQAAGDCGQRPPRSRPRCRSLGRRGIGPAFQTL